MCYIAVGKSLSVHTGSMCIFRISILFLIPFQRVKPSQISERYMNNYALYFIPWLLLRVNPNTVSSPTQNDILHADFGIVLMHKHNSYLQQSQRT